MTAAFANEPEFNVQFKEAIEYQRQKVNLPTKTWRDIEGRSNDRAFVVAGAIKEELLADLRNAVDKAVAGNSTLADFRKEFDALVARNGWTGWTGEDTEAGRAWRTRVIFETNLSTAYAAGRYAQMTDKDVLAGYPYWRYRHAYYREPAYARAKHLAWDQITLKATHDFWKTHYPPNDFFCSCGVEPMAEYELKAEGIEPSADPVISYRTVVDPRTGDKMRVPDGIGLGWDHAPGRDWSHGLVPPPLQVPLPASGQARHKIDLPELSLIAKPFKAKPLPEDTEPEAAADLFLAAFGATRDAPVMFRDVAGHAIPISESLFQRGDGRSKANKRSRNIDMLMLAETIEDPDEIWVDWIWHRDSAQWILARRYLRLSPNGLGFGSFMWSRKGWEGSTVFSPTKDNQRNPDPAYIENQRKGALLWRRPKK